MREGTSGFLLICSEILLLPFGHHLYALPLRTGPLYYDLVGDPKTGCSRGLEGLNPKFRGHRLLFSRVGDKGVERNTTSIRRFSCS